MTLPTRSRWLGCALGVLGLLGCSSGGETAAGFPEKDRAAEAARLLAGPEWYRHAIFYEVYVRSLQDSNGDGIGDLPGLTSRLDDLRALGVDALWLMPIMASPFADSGYDVADYQAVNPDYGSLDDFSALLDAAHARGMRVVIDLVLNHTSIEHPWFQESRSSRDNPKADWYVWSDTAGRSDIGCGTVPTFGTEAWTFEPLRNQYYFHRFYPAQPDLNYRNPAVVSATLDVARFWLGRGADGFRCDVIGLLFESADGCDMIPETMGYIRQQRAVLDEYPDRAMVAENFDFDTATAYFGNGRDMFHMAFDFPFGFGWSGYFPSSSTDSIGARFTRVRDTYPPGAQDALFIGSHDFERAYAKAQGVESHWRRAAFLQLTMPGTPFIYYGEELALRPGTAQLVDARDHARTPMLWRADPGWGFTTGTPWLAFGAEPEATNLALERIEADSGYAFYRNLLGLRRGREAFGTGALRIVATTEPAILLWTRASADETYAMALSVDETAEHTATAADAELPGDPVLLLGNASLVREEGAARVTVPPAGMAVFRVR